MQPKHPWYTFLIMKDTKENANTNIKATNEGPTIESTLNAGITNKVFPGLVLYIVRDEKLVFKSIRGYRSVHPDKLPMKEDTLFDLASITKPLATTLTALKIFEEERIKLETPVSHFLNPRESEHLLARAKSYVEKITLFHLLTHTSGFPPVPDIYKHFRETKTIDPLNARKLLLEVTPTNEPGKEIIYSCTGFLYLGYILERITGVRLGTLFEKLIAEKAGIKNLTFLPTRSSLYYKRFIHSRENTKTRGEEIPTNPPQSLAEKIATEKNFACTEYCKWRKRWICGEVHDENSYCFGGDGGNAGLFGTAEAVASILRIFTEEGCIGNTRILSEESIKLMTKRAVSHNGQNRSIGFIMQGENAPCGPLYSRDSYGHTGFTGTSVWIEPELNLKVILLTNRVHYGREETAEKIKEFRVRLHTAIYKTFA